MATKKRTFLIYPKKYQVAVVQIDAAKPDDAKIQALDLYDRDSPDLEWGEEYVEIEELKTLLPLRRKG